MTDHQLVIDHVHVISRDPAAAVSWYVDKLGGKIVNEVEVQGAPQIFVELGGMAVAIRGIAPAKKSRTRRASSGESIISASGWTETSRRTAIP